MCGGRRGGVRLKLASSPCLHSTRSALIKTRTRESKRSALIASSGSSRQRPLLRRPREMQPWRSGFRVANFHRGRANSEGLQGLKRGKKNCTRDVELTVEKIT